MPGAMGDTFGVVELTAITPSDTTDQLAAPSPPFRALYVGGLGDVRIQPLEGAPQTLPGLAPGVFHPIVFRRVLATGTTATSIFGGR